MSRTSAASAAVPATGSSACRRVRVSPPCDRDHDTLMPCSSAPPRENRPSSGSDQVIVGAIAFSSGGLDRAAIHWVFAKQLGPYIPPEPLESGSAAAHRTVS